MRRPPPPARRPPPEALQHSAARVPGALWGAPCAGDAACAPAGKGATAGQRKSEARPPRRSSPRAERARALASERIRPAAPGPGPQAAAPEVARPVVPQELPPRQAARAAGRASRRLTEWPASAPRRRRDRNARRSWYVLRFHAQLPPVHPAVDAFGLQQAPWRAVLDDVAAVEHHDAVERVQGR